MRVGLAHERFRSIIYINDKKIMPVVWETGDPLNIFFCLPVAVINIDQKQANKIKFVIYGSALKYLF